ncbi:sugar ABC transporter permease [Cohnella lubricantis]|uniref:Sugar ABC transporter permease n=1 Tax=Cohnella lubricantis TaxID=2163172 RepID=A0A841THJ6_9BACL|nr:sugar ABC transporter permease [Cohnella lubricantis]MBB6677931.1 sugar ABC transporter permease [Cohnella lubricantis]MBP2120336.1 raffinose/stachyose/melibiose transport system permease protein [Cohnella lubricantis]
MHSFLNRKSAIFVFVFPFLALYTAIMAYPIFQVFVKSFYEWDGITSPIFSGLDNYRNMLKDSDFIPAVKNGLIFAAVILVYQQVVASILAFIFTSRNLKLRGSKFFKTSFFVPVVLSVTVVGQLWVQLFNYDHGLVNNLLGIFGDDFRQAFLSDPRKAIYAVAFTNGWQFMGMMFVFIYAAIKSIPEQYFEAAIIDGASPFTLHRKITLPMLQETYKFTLVMSITGGLKAFDNMFVMTGGGPGGSTMTLSYMMFKSAFQKGEFGYGCASAVVLLLECLLATLIINKFIARDRIVY